MCRNIPRSGHKTGIHLKCWMALSQPRGFRGTHAWAVVVWRALGCLGWGQEALFMHTPGLKQPTGGRTELQPSEMRLSPCLCTIVLPQPGPSLAPREVVGHVGQRVWADDVPAGDNSPSTLLESEEFEILYIAYLLSSTLVWIYSDIYIVFYTANLVSLPQMFAEW